MPSSRSRLTIRQMLLAVAIFAVALNIGLSYRMSGEYRRRAQFYTRAGEAASLRAQNVESGVLFMKGYTAEEKQNLIGQAKRLIEYANRMRAKYERAAYIPWLPLEPD